MLRLILLCAVVAACTTMATAPPLGVALVCQADAALECPPGGCTATQPGRRWTEAVTLSPPAEGEIGRLCDGEGCRAARFRPTLTRALGWTANISVSPNWDQPSAEVEIGSNRTSFRLREANGDRERIWVGACSAAGS